MSEKIVIDNDQLEVSVSTMGGELQSVKSKKDGYEYIWQADAKYWGRHAPVLFPFIGRSNDNSYLLDGQKYSMKQHGFLRDYDFELVHQEKDSVKLLFESNPETRKVYPYDFSVELEYKLSSKQLEVIYRINNFTANTMYYSLGFHPAFNIEGDLADYRLDFAPEQEKLTDLLIDPAPFRSGKEATVELKDSSLPLSYPMLDKGLKIYNADDISTVKLTSSHTHSITMDLHDFPFLAVWSPEKKQAPFVCVEAFRGLPDQYGKVGELKEKKGEQVVFPELYNLLATSITFN